MPLAPLILARLELVTASCLGWVRKYAFLAITILAAVLSPSDVISMLIRVLLYALDELAGPLARIAAPKNA